MKFFILFLASAFLLGFSGIAPLPGFSQQSCFAEEIQPASEGIQLSGKYRPGLTDKLSVQSLERQDSANSGPALLTFLKKTGTDGFLIVSKDQVIFEKYFNGYSADKKHVLWSVSKSVVNTLFGIAEHKGLLNRKDSLAKFFPETLNSTKEEIILSHLLQMSSGLGWKEAYEVNTSALLSGKVIDSDVVDMLYRTENMARFALENPLTNAPGSKFYYSSGTSNILTATLRQVMSEKDYSEFPWKELFEPLGITDASWERDRSGNIVGSSYLYLRPRDLLKIGKLYLANGIWEKKRLLPEDWVKYSTAPADSFWNTELEGFANRENYGAHWWLNRENKSKNLPRPYPKAPEDAYMALGHYGQILAIFPDDELILVRTAFDKDGEIDRNRLFELALQFASSHE